MWRAYVDESESNQRLDPGTYIFAATLVEDAHADEVREAMDALRPPGRRKLHWYDLSGRNRLAVIKTIVELPALHVAVVRSVLPPERPDRRRRKCLNRLTHELENRRVTHIIAEAREPKNDLRERDYLNRLRVTGVVDEELRLVHQRGQLEPLLWAADAIAGAVVAARIDEPKYLELLAGLVDIAIEP
ncbi:DUF3800 domain-containing protein [Tenggerimyces flavus]|uniref:DUF3800 domain-containing protein n=1 Tax=Tenggerimyces flavus TaxID=1708749 RepID=A0ABV7Y928_9ACTN